MTTESARATSRKKDAVILGLNELPPDGFVVPETNGVIGKLYSTRKGPLPLKPHYFLAVENRLQGISGDIAKVNMAGADLRARAALREALGNWYDNVKAKWDEKVNILPEKSPLRKKLVLARIPVNSCYRRLGETCANDGHGALDSDDDYGHWRGFSADIQVNYWGSWCCPKLSQKEVLEAAYDADLKRPWYSGDRYKNEKGKGEWWHFRPEDHLLPTTESPEVP